MIVSTTSFISWMQASFQHEHQRSAGIARKMSFCTLSSFDASCCRPTKLSLSITALYVWDAVQTVGCTWQVSGVLGAGRSLAECSRSSQLRLCWTSSTSLSDITLSERERERVRDRGVRLNQKFKGPYRTRAQFISIEVWFPWREYILLDSCFYFFSSWCSVSDDFQHLIFHAGPQHATVITCCSRLLRNEKKMKNLLKTFENI